MGNCAIPYDAVQPTVQRPNGKVQWSPMEGDSVCSALEEASIVYVGISFARSLLIYSQPPLHSHTHGSLICHTETQGLSLPPWLAAGKPAYIKGVVRRKDEPPVQPAHITQVINPFFARVEQPVSRIDTISIQTLSPSHSPTDMNPNVGIVAMEPSSSSPSLGEVVAPESLDHTSMIEALTEMNMEEVNEEDKNDPASSRPVRQRKPPNFYQSSCGFPSMGECCEQCV